MCARDILIANKAYGQGVREAWSKQAYVASRSFFDKIADEYKEEMFAEMVKLYRVILGDGLEYKNFTQDEIKYMITAAGCRTYREHCGLFPELYKITEIRKISSELFRFLRCAPRKTKPGLNCLIFCLC